MTATTITTTTSSNRVKPAIANRRTEEKQVLRIHAFISVICVISAPVILLLSVQRSFAQIPDWKEDTQRKNQHHDAKSTQQDRLYLCTQGLHFIFNLALVHPGDFLHQVIDLAGFFPHRQHLQHNGCKYPGADRGTQQALAPLYAV